MGILSTLKSLLGDRSADAGTPVAVEREPAAESERAVKGVDAPPSPGDAGPPDAAESGEPDGEPVEAIKGVGAAYADRLATAEVHTVGDLAASDAETLAAETDIGVGRLENWIEQARARTR